MQTLGLVVLWSLLLPASGPVGVCGRVDGLLERHQSTSVVLIALADSPWAADQVGASADGILGDEEDPEDGDLFDVDLDGSLPVTLTPQLMTVGVDCRLRGVGAVVRPIPLRC